MADYTQSIDFGDKDALASGHASKIAKGVDIDTELGLISTAIASKVDESREGQANGIATLDASALVPVAQLPQGTTAAIGALELATTAEVVTGTSSSLAVTPEGVEAWAAQNASMIKDISDLADPGVDTVLGWDESDNAVIGFTLAEGLEFSTTTLTIADQAVSATVPVKLTAGALGWSTASITEITAAGLDQAADGFLVHNAGVLNVIPYDNVGLIVQTIAAAGADRALAITDANTLIEVNDTINLTIPANAAVPFIIGSFVVFVVDHATEQLAIIADTGVTLNSVWHPGGGSAATDHVRSGGTAVLIKTATNEWYLSGDILT